MQLPEPEGSEQDLVSGRPASEARFPGAFVLYNYARMATILSRHQQLVDKGEDIATTDIGRSHDTPL